MTASPAHIGPAQDLIPLSEQLDNRDEYAPEATDGAAQQIRTGSIATLLNVTTYDGL